jgi:hypothetical protein
VLAFLYCIELKQRQQFGGIPQVIAIGGDFGSDSLSGQATDMRSVQGSPPKITTSLSLERHVDF